MTTTTNFRILPEPLKSHQGLKGERQVASGQPSLSRSKAETEPETRLWKICAKAASPGLSGVEWIALLLLATAAFGALACCFWESFRLFNGGALDQTVQALLTR
jgi:hypothetical protein